MLKKPVWACIFSVLMTVLFIAAGRILGLLPMAGTNWGDLVLELFLAGLSALMLLALRRGRVLWASGAGFGEGVRAGGFLIGYLVLAFFGQVVLWERAPVPNGQALSFVLYMFVIGMAEELMFRGVVQNVLADAFGRHTRRGVWLTVTVSGLIFGLAHLTNIFVGVAPLGALMQAVAASAIGMYMGAVYARCGNIWFLVLLHGFNDLVGLMTASGLETSAVVEELSAYGLERLVAVVLYVALTAFLLRKKKMAAIIGQ